jgi:hypothetical protein
LYAVGLLWAGLTLAFEIALGRLVFHYAWVQIFADHNLLQGGLMGIGLTLLILAPSLPAKIQKI